MPVIEENNHNNSSLSENDLVNGGSKHKSLDRQHLITDGLNGSYGGTDGPAGDEKKEEEKNKTPKVGFFRLFRFADKWDTLMILVGTVCAIGHGCSWPFSIYILGETIQDFVDFGKYENFLDKIPDFLKLVNVSKEAAKQDIDLLLPYCPLLATFNQEVNCESLPTTEDVFDSMKDKALFYLYIGFVVMLCAYGQIFFFIVSSERQIIRMRLAFYRNIIRQEMAWFDAHSPGELAVKFTDDIGKIHEAIGDKSGTAVQQYSAFVCGMVICFLHGWKLTLVMLVFGPLLFVSFAIIGMVLATMTTKERVAYANAGTIAEEVLSGIRTVHAFGGQEKEAARYSTTAKEAMAYGIRKGMVTGIGRGMSWFAMLSNLSVGMYYGGQLVRYGEYDAQDMMTIQLASLIGCLSLGLAIPSVVTINVGRGACYDVFNMIDKKSTIDSLSTQGLKPSSLKGNIRFKGVHFSYPSRPSVKVLNGLDLSVRSGQTVALVGESGCGKSTAIQLLQRLYDPCQGEISLDGVDIRDINIKWLRQSMGLVGQEPVLFATSVAENIRYGNENATMEQIIQASKNANAYNFIMKMPDKFNTHVGERGAQLSGGQKQRIAIARALVKDPKILLLDEATSALDTGSEVVVQDALDKASKGRTTIVVAHRLSTIRHADVIVAFDKGKIAESGTYDELMAKKGIYFNLVETQIKNKEYTSQSESDGEEMIKPLSLVDKTLTQTDDPDAALSYDLSESSTEDSLGRYNSATSPEWRMLRINSSEWLYIVLAALASVLNGCLQPTWSVILSVLLKAFADDDLGYQKDQTTKLSIITLCISFVMIFTYFLQEYGFAVAGENLTLRMRDMLFRAMLRQNIAWFDDKRHETGILTSHLAVEASVIQGSTKTLIGSTLYTAANFVTAFTIAFIFGWQLALSLLIFIPFIILSGLMYVKMMTGSSSKNAIAIEKVSKEAMSSVDNIRTVTALTREELFCKQFSETLWEPCKGNWKSTAYSCALNGVSQGMYYVAHAVCFYYGAKLLKDGELEFDDVYKVFGCIILSAAEVGRAVALAPDLSNARKAARKIFALHDSVPPIDAYSTTGEKPMEGSFKNSVHFKQVHFRYPMRPHVVVLNGLDITVDQGQTLALVGESGCGKSTTVQIIERFYDPESGSVHLGKYNTRDLNLQWLRSQIGLVSQEPVLFDQSIAYNIAYGDNSREVTMDEIIRVAKSSNIHNFIQSLPQGYDTNVGSKGTQLSGGQKQRVAIARALVRNPKILLLDEATSALDTESEKIVQDALDKAREGRTCIIIAHRLSTIKNADKIAVLRAGVVQEIGTHSELMSKHGLYRMLQNVQGGRR